MTKQEYVKAMTYMGIVFNKPVEKDVVEVWYDFLKDIPEKTLINAIKKLALKTKFFPGIQEIVEMCGNVQNNQSNEILKIMFDNGYFHKGSYGELDSEHAFRNYEKALMWISKGIIPNWLLEDMIAYGYQGTNKLIYSDQLLLGVSND